MLKKIFILIQIFIFVTLPLIAIAQTTDDGINDIVIMVHDYGSASTANYYSTIRNKSGGSTNNGTNWDWSRFFTGDQSFFDKSEIYLPNISNDENGNGVIEEHEEDTQRLRLGVLSHDAFDGWSNFDYYGNEFESNNRTLLTQSIEMRDHLINGQVTNVQSIPPLYNGDGGKEYQALLLAHSQGGARSAAYAIDQRLFRTNEYYKGKISGNWNLSNMKEWDKAPTVRGLITMGSLLNGGVPAVNNLPKGIVENKFLSLSNSVIFNNSLSIFLGSLSIVYPIYNILFITIVSSITTIVTSFLIILGITKYELLEYRPEKRIIMEIHKMMEDFGYYQDTGWRPGGEDLGPDSKFSDNYMGGDLRVSNIVYKVWDEDSGTWKYYYYIPQKTFNTPDHNVGEMINLNNEISELPIRVKLLLDKYIKYDEHDIYPEESQQISFDDYDFLDYDNGMGVIVNSERVFNWPINLFSYDPSNNIIDYPLSSNDIINSRSYNGSATSDIFNLIRTLINNEFTDHNSTAYKVSIALLDEMIDYYDNNLNAELSSYQNASYMDKLYDLLNYIEYDRYGVLDSIQEKYLNDDTEVLLASVDRLFNLATELTDIENDNLKLTNPDIPLNLIYKLYCSTKNVFDYKSDRESIDPNWNPEWWDDTLDMIDPQLYPDIDVDPDYQSNPIIVRYMRKLHDRFCKITVEDHLYGTDTQPLTHYDESTITDLISFFEGGESKNGLHYLLCDIDQLMTADDGVVVTLNKPLSDVYYATISGGESHPIELFHDVFSNFFLRLATDYWTIVSFLTLLELYDITSILTSSWLLATNINNPVVIASSLMIIAVAVPALYYTSDILINFATMKHWWAKDICGGVPADGLIPAENGQYPVDLIGGMPLDPDDKINIPNVDTQYSHFHYPDLVHGWSSTNPETSKSVTDNYEVMQKIEDLMGDYEFWMDKERSGGNQ